MCVSDGALVRRVNPNPPNLAVRGQAPLWGGLVTCRVLFARAPVLRLCVGLPPETALGSSSWNYACAKRGRIQILPNETNNNQQQLTMSIHTVDVDHRIASVCLCVAGASLVRRRLERGGDGRRQGPRQDPRLYPQRQGGLTAQRHRLGFTRDCHHQ